MTLLAPDLTLFGSEEPIIRQAAKTHGGMAHFAGTGPIGRTCRDCQNWQVMYGSRKACKGATCSIYRRLMGGKLGPSFPAASACKYFEEVRS